MRNFSHKLANQKIIFGVGTVSDLPRELKILCIKRPFIISSSGRDLLASNIISILGDKFDCHSKYAKSYIHEEEFDFCSYAIKTSVMDYRFFSNLVSTTLHLTEKPAKLI